MAKAKAVAMPDFIPDEEISQYESAPDFISDEEMAGTAAPVNAAEELRAKRVRTASPQELRKIHFGENIPAGARAEQVSPVSEFATAFGIRGPAKAIGGIESAAQEIYRTAGKPIEQAKMLGGALRGIATKPFKDVGKLATGTPTEAGEAAFNLGALTAPAAPALKAGGAQAVSRLQTKAGQIASRPKSLAYGALSERIGPGTSKAQRLEKEINTGLEPVFDFAANAKRKINNVDDLGSAAKDMAKVTDFEFNQAIDRVGDRLVSGRPVAQEIRDEITDLVRTTNPAQAENLERIAASFDREMPIREVNQLRQEANNVLDKFYAKSPLQQEHPAIGIAAQSGMADGLRKVLYDNLDEIYVDSPSIRQMMRERGAAEGISKYASESSGGSRRQGMAETNVRGPVTTPLTLGAKAVKTVFSPTATAKKVEKFAQRPDRKISEAYKLYSPRKARAPIGDPQRPQFPKERLGGNLPPGQEQMPFVPPGVGAMGRELPNQFDPLQSRIALPNELTKQFNQPLNVPQPGQGGLQFAPPGVGAMGRELPLEGTASRAIQMPNELTRRFNQPPTVAEDINQPNLFGQTQMPFVEPNIGGIPQQSFGFQGVDIQRPAGLPPNLENMTLGQYMNLLDLNPRAAEFIDNFIRTTKGR